MGLGGRRGVGAGGGLTRRAVWEEKGYPRTWRTDAAVKDKIACSQKALDHVLQLKGIIWSTSTRSPAVWRCQVLSVGMRTEFVQCRSNNEAAANTIRAVCRYQSKLVDSSHICSTLSQMLSFLQYTSWYHFTAQKNRDTVCAEWLRIFPLATAKLKAYQPNQMHTVCKCMLCIFSKAKTEWEAFGRDEPYTLPLHSHHNGFSHDSIMLICVEVKGAFTHDTKSQPTAFWNPLYLIACAVQQWSQWSFI